MQVQLQALARGVIQTFIFNHVPDRLENGHIIKLIFFPVRVEQYFNTINTSQLYYWPKLEFKLCSLICNLYATKTYLKSVPIWKFSQRGPHFKESKEWSILDETMQKDDMKVRIILPRSKQNAKIAKTHLRLKTV